MTPSHIAFIMDGNGRWAERRHMPRKYGHKMGTQTLENVVELAAKYGIKTVTFYAFSTENWTRPQSEIDYLFGIFRKFLSDIDRYKQKNVKLCFIGNLGGLPKDVADACVQMTEKTKENTGVNVVIALNYGSWEEITSSVNRLLQSGKTKVEKEDIVKALYTRDLPFPDLVVRTGGEVRLSNFLLLQSAYAELVFTDTLWPDFDEKAFVKVLDEYSSRVRKYGGLKKGDAQA